MLNRSNNFENNDYLNQYVSLLIQLHQLMREGKEEEADDLREFMDAPGIHLSGQEIQWVKRLSAELYSVSDEELFEDNPYAPERWRNLALTAFANRMIDTERLLALLRMKQNSIKPEIVAYARSRAYAQQGFYDLAFIFLQRAMQLSSEGNESKKYLIFLMHDLEQVGGYSQLWDVAQTIFDTEGMSPERIFLAAGTIYRARNYFTDVELRPLLGRLHQEIEKALKTAYNGQFFAEDMAFGNVLLGIIQNALGRKAKAEVAYLNAARLNPVDDTPWLLLGELMLLSKPAKAVFAFQQAVKLETQNPIPYLAIAMISLNQGEHEAATKYSLIALDKNTGGNKNYRNKVTLTVNSFLSQIEEAKSTASAPLTSVQKKFSQQKKQSVFTSRDFIDEFSGVNQTEHGSKVMDLFAGMDFLSIRLNQFERAAELRMTA